MSSNLFKPASILTLSVLAVMALGLHLGTLMLGFGPVFAETKPSDGVAPYDGVYTVDIETTAGSCDKAGQMTIAIVNGKVAATGDLSVQTSGLIDPSGIVSLAFKNGTDVTHVAGRMNGKSGAGTWSSPTKLCGGRWRAARHD
jgi:hypothetical protein